MGRHPADLVALEVIRIETEAPSPPSGVVGEPGVVVEKELPRWVRWVLRFDIGTRPDQCGTEFTVRRRIHAGIDASIPAVLAVACDLPTDPTDPTDPIERRGGAATSPARVPASSASSSRRRRHAWLELRLDATRFEGGIVRIPARLHGAWLPRAVPVELDVEAWSSSQSELRLQSRRRHGGARPSPRYFDAAHDVLDALRAAAEAEIARRSDRTCR
jgi:hypothetical protein